MKETFQRITIGEGIHLSTVRTDKFNTSRISVNLILPLQRDYVTTNALIAFLMRKGCKSYPDFTALNRRLSELYGATISTDIRKIGDNQVINISGQCIDDVYALEGEQLLDELSDLICEIITQPLMRDGLFPAAEIEVEKKILLDTIQSELNDKRDYLIAKTIRAMCVNEPYGLPKYGFAEDLSGLTPERVTEQYHRLLRHCSIEILCVGANFNEAIQDRFTTFFSSIERNSVYNHQSVPSPRSELREITEHKKIRQSKLALGFRIGHALSAKELDAMRLMSAIYGATPSSKLFLNVREKLSLCYYCTSMFDKYKGILMVDCGIEAQNRQKTVDEILRQLAEMQSGNFSEEELENARAALLNSYKTVPDSLGGLESWYLGQILAGSANAPLEESANVLQVTREEICAAAQALQLDTLYFLTGEEEG